MEQRREGGSTKKQRAKEREERKEELEEKRCGDEHKGWICRECSVGVSYG